MFSFLKQKGYTIQCARERVPLDQAANSFDLVSSSSIENEQCLAAANEARRHLLVPSVLFQIGDATPSPKNEPMPAKPHDSDHDLIIAANTSPYLWLSELEALIAQGRRFRQAAERIITNSIRLRAKTPEVIENAHHAIQRAKSQIARNIAPAAISRVLAHQVLTCKACGTPFVFSTGEQLRIHLQNGVDVPDKCDQCRSVRDEADQPPT